MRPAAAAHSAWREYRPESCNVGRSYKSVVYKQAAGKTTLSIEKLVMDKDGGRSLKLFFTDGTVPLWDMRARLEIQAQYLRAEGGDLKRI